MIFQTFKTFKTFKTLKTLNKQKKMFGLFSSATTTDVQKMELDSDTKHDTPKAKADQGTMIKQEYGYKQFEFDLKTILGLPISDPDNLSLTAKDLRANNLAKEISIIMNGINDINENYRGFAMEYDIQRANLEAVTTNLKNKGVHIRVEGLDDSSEVVRVTISWSDKPDPFTNVTAHKCRVNSRPLSDTYGYTCLSSGLPNYLSNSRYGNYNIYDMKYLRR